MPSSLHGLERLILVDINPAVTAAFELHFDEEPLVEVVTARFEELPEYDCMVSPANSFGLMDGGADLAIINYFGLDLMDRVQAAIRRQFFGEQPVGTSIIVETNHPEHPFVAHTPTMRVPMDIRGTDNVYLAMFAMLTAVAHHNDARQLPPIRTVACPGLGTFYGKMDLNEAARQMRLGLQSLQYPIERASWPAAKVRSENVRPRA